LDHFRVRATYGFSKDVQVNAAQKGYYEDPTALEATLGKSDVMYKAEQTLLGSSASIGIAGIVDNSGTYAGLNASTVTQWAGEENAVSGALTIAAMNTLYIEMISASGGSSVPRGASPTNWLMPPNQVNNYSGLGDGRATTGSVWRVTSNGGADFGVLRPSGMAHNGLPIVSVENITSTEVYLVDVTDIELIVAKDWEVELIPTNPENAQYQVSFWLAHKFTRRNHHGKMTAVTA
jgi:hypothetical protein